MTPGAAIGSLSYDLGRRYDPPAVRAPGLDEQLRRVALEEFTTGFTTPELLTKVPGATAVQARRVLTQLLAAGRIERTGKGRGTRWMAVR